ncbi:780_t:CDS:1, partial [Funneliformis geosporum]
VTDYSALNWLLTNKHVKGRVARWALFLQVYDFTIKHRPGDKNQNADTFSRMVPINMTLTKEGEEKDNQWMQVHFSALNVPGCQTKWQWNGLYNNRKYRKNTYACEENDHHSHWY